MKIELQSLQYYDINQHNDLPNQYTQFFQQIQQQVDHHINTIINNQSLLKKLKIKTLFNLPNFDKKSAYNKAPIKKKYESDTTIVNFSVMQSGFLIDVRMLNIKQNRLLHNESTQLKFSDTQYCQKTNTFIRKIRFGQHTQILEQPNWKIKSNWNQMDYIIRLVSIYKICDLFNIGPRLINRLGFQIICYQDCCQFFLQKSCKNLQKISIPDLQHRLKFCLRLLHKLNLTYNFWEISNINYSIHGYQYILDHFELVSPREQIFDDLISMIDGSDKKVRQQNIKCGILYDIDQLQFMLTKLDGQQMKIQQISGPQRIEQKKSTIISLSTKNESQGFQFQSNLINHQFNIQQKIQYFVRVCGFQPTLLSILKYWNQSPEKNLIIAKIIKKEKCYTEKNIVVQKKFEYICKKLQICRNNNLNQLNKILGSIDPMIINYILPFLYRKICDILKISYLNFQQIQYKKLIHDLQNLSNSIITDNTNELSQQYLILYFKIVCWEQKYDLIISYYQSKKTTYDIFLLSIIEISYFRRNNFMMCKKILESNIFQNFPVYRQFRYLDSYYFQFENYNQFQIKNEIEEVKTIKNKLRIHLKNFENIISQQQIHINYQFYKYTFAIRELINSILLPSLQTYYSIIQCTTIPLTDLLTNIIIYHNKMNNLKKVKQYIPHLLKIINQPFHEYHKAVCLIKIQKIIQQFKTQNKIQNDGIENCKFGYKLLEQLLGKGSRLVLNQVFQLAKKLSKKKKYREAIQLVLENLKYCENEDQYQVKIKFNFLLENCYELLNQKQQSQKYRQKISIQLDQYSKDQFYIECNFRLIQQYKFAENYKKGISISLKLGKIIQSLKLKNPIYIFKNKLNLSILYFQQGHFNQSFQIISQILETGPNILGTYHSIIKQAYGILGMYYRFKKQYTKAIFCLHNALFQQNHQCFKNNNNQYFNTFYLKNLGICYYNLKQKLHCLYIINQIKQNDSFQIIKLRIRLLKKFNKFGYLEKEITKNLRISRSKGEKLHPHKNQFIQLIHNQAYLYKQLVIHYFSRKKYQKAFMILLILKKIISMTKNDFIAQIKKISKKFSQKLDKESKIFLKNQIKGQNNIVVPDLSVQQSFKLLRMLKKKSFAFQKISVKLGFLSAKSQIKSIVAHLNK